LPTDKKLPTDYRFFLMPIQLASKKFKQNNCGKIIFDGFLNQLFCHKRFYPLAVFSSVGLIVFMPVWL